MRDGHPLTNGAVTKERLFEFPHVVVELTGTEEKGWSGFIDERELTRRNWIERLIVETEAEANGPVARVPVTVPYYAAAVPLLECTDMVATLPRSLAEPDCEAEPADDSRTAVWTAEGFGGCCVASAT